MTAPFDVTPVHLETDRLILRPLAECDLADFHEYASDPEVSIPGGWDPYKDIEESKEHLLKIIAGKDCLALIDKETGKMIGTIALQSRNWPKYPIDQSLQGREYGFELNKHHWGRGLMPEAVRAVTDYCFETLHFDYVTCGHFLGNEKSARAIQKSGFTFLFDDTDTLPTGRTEHIFTYIRYNPNQKASPV